MLECNISQMWPYKLWVLCSCDNVTLLPTGVSQEEGYFIAAMFCTELKSYLCAMIFSQTKGCHTLFIVQLSYIVCSALNCWILTHQSLSGPYNGTWSVDCLIPSFSFSSIKTEQPFFWPFLEEIFRRLLESLLHLLHYLLTCIGIHFDVFFCLYNVTFQMVW